MEGSVDMAVGLSSRLCSLECTPGPDDKARDAGTRPALPPCYAAILLNGLAAQFSQIRAGSGASQKVG